MDIWIQSAGTVLVLAAFMDTFLTVLYARSGKGLLSPYINRAVWWMFQGAARLLPSLRGGVLSFTGPALVVILASVWILLYVAGFGLIIWPELGDAIQASQGSTPTDFTAALYYSGYSFSTLGTGDLVPQTGFYRVLMVLKAALGFSFFTLVITYILSIYEAIRARNVFGLQAHHQTNRTGDPAQFVVGLAAGGDFQGFRLALSSLSGQMANLSEMHEFYPILHYFRFKKTYYALPRIMLILLDTASILKTVPDPDRHGEVTRSSAVDQLWSASSHTMEHLSLNFLPEGASVDKHRLSEQEIRLWERRYQDVARRLSAEGITTVPDGEAGRERYIDSVKQWYPYVAAFTTSLLYPKEEMMPYLFEDEDDGEWG